MAIDLVTGQPGHGKTAYAIDKAFEAQKEGREIYAHGIKDFDYAKAGFKHIEDPTKWEELPDGAFLLLDECYTSFPNRNPGSKVPSFVEALARHRHRGFDFMLVCQQGLQLDPFIRGLVETHTHVRQTSVFKKKTKLKKWTQFQSNTQGHCGDVEDWIRPDYVFQFYTSTTKITTKRTMPSWLRWLLIGFGFLAVLALGMKWYFSAKIASYAKEPNGGLAAAAQSTAAARDAAAPRSYDSPTDYAIAHVPRLPGQPWSAPIYDGAAPAKQPGLFCMSSMPSEDDPREPSCTCVYEDGSRYVPRGPEECRTVARFGPEYNPYSTPAQPMASVQPVGPVPHASAGQQGSSIDYKPGTRSDVFPLNPARTGTTWTPPVTTL